MTVTPIRVLITSALTTWPSKLGGTNVEEPAPASDAVTWDRTA